MKNAFRLLIASFLLVGAGCFGPANVRPGTRVPPTPASAPAPNPAQAAIDAHASLIQVDNVKVGDTATSPLVVTGKARGTWYFEASFPARLLDADSNVLAAVPAQAQGDWMTEDFVPFKAVLEFTTPKTAAGTLVLAKDNPSGLPEHEDEIRIPVRFTAVP